MIRLSRREFERLARRAYRQLPLAVRASLDNVDITIEEWPGPEEADLAGDEGGLLGLYTGVPLTHREGGAPELPDRICLYRQPILRSCSTRAQVVEEVRITLWHEVGHYLGMDEADLHRLGYG
jgi:predicted Zn-dependent protease with MMP-like domain